MFLPVYSFLVAINCTRRNYNYNLCFRENNSKLKCASNLNPFSCESFENSLPEREHFTKFSAKINDLVRTLQYNMEKAPSSTFDDLKKSIDSEDVQINEIVSKLKFEFVISGFHVFFSKLKDGNGIFYIFLPVTKKIFQTLASISNFSTQKEIDGSMFTLKTYTRRLVQSLFNLKGFFDNEQFYDEFVLQTVIK